MFDFSCPHLYTNINASATTKYTAPTKTEYHIGETFDVSGAAFEYQAETTQVENVNVIKEMYNEGDSSSLETSNYQFTELNKGTKKATVTYTFNYGNIMNENGGKADNGTSYATSVTVSPVSTTISKEALGLSEDAKISAVSVDGDAAKFNVKKLSKSLEVTGYAIDKEILINVSTSDNQTIKVSVAVDHEGNITSKVNEQDVVFVPEEITFTKDDLYLVPKNASSTDNDIAKAEIEDGKVIITSVGEGTATITVTDKEGNEATIDVIVSEDGSMTTDVHGYLDEVWVGETGGDWYYYQKGEMVKSNWVEITEGENAGWYHFGADGKMQRGWIVDETGWKIYYLDTNGRMYKDMWVNADAQESLGMSAGMYHLTADGPVQMNGWAASVDNPNIEWFCNAGTGLFEVNNPASWRIVG